MTISVTFNFDKKYWLDKISDGTCRNKRHLRDYVAYAKDEGATEKEVKAALKKGGYLA